MTGGVLVWAAVKAAMAVLGVLVPAIRGGPSVTDPAGLAVPDTADGFFGVLHLWDSGYFQGIAAEGYFAAGAGASVQSFFPGYPAAETWHSRHDLFQTASMTGRPANWVLPAPPAPENAGLGRRSSS